MKFVISDVREPPDRTYEVQTVGLHFGATVTALCFSAIGCFGRATKNAGLEKGTPKCSIFSLLFFHFRLLLSFFFYSFNYFHLDHNICVLEVPCSLLLQELEIIRNGNNYKSKQTNAAPDVIVIVRERVTLLCVIDVKKSYRKNI